jgi:hypothetical protein
MSSVSQKLEALAETHCVNVLVIQEWYLERLAIMQADNVADAERLAIEDIAAELEGRKV